VNLGRVVLIVLGAVLLQVVLARYMVGGRMAFDLVLVGVVYVSLQTGPVGGMLAGTLGGLLHDLAAGGLIGVGGLLKTVMGCLTGVLGTQFVVAKPYARALIVAAATLVHAFLTVGLQGVIGQRWPGLAWSLVVEEMLLNALAGYVAFYVTDSLSGAMARGRSRQRSSWGRRQW
jgi:rod shape-determining protein MreD